MREFADGALEPVEPGWRVRLPECIELFNGGLFHVKHVTGRETAGRGAKTSSGKVSRGTGPSATEPVNTGRLPGSSGQTAFSKTDGRRSSIPRQRVRAIARRTCV